MGANDVHGDIRQMTLAADYKTSVNESETITDAQAVERRLGHQARGCGPRSRFGARFALVARNVAAVARNIERS
jgi:hypothetical protein